MRLVSGHEAVDTLSGQLSKSSKFPVGFGVGRWLAQSDHNHHVGVGPQVDVGCAAQTQIGGMLGYRCCRCGSTARQLVTVVVLSTGYVGDVGDVDVCSHA